jgi:transcriptional regulator with XRE-family HTH domain
MPNDHASRQRQIDEMIGMYMMLMRLEGRLSENQICEELDIAPSTLRSYERGERSVPAARLYLFAEMAEVKMDFFFADMLERLRE